MEEEGNSSDPALPDRIGKNKETDIRKLASGHKRLVGETGAACLYDLRKGNSVLLLFHVTQGPRKSSPSGKAGTSVWKHEVSVREGKRSCSG